VEVITNSTGKLLPPGSAGGVVAKIWKPGIRDSLACTCGRISNTVRVRVPHGSSTMPLKPSAPSCAPTAAGSRSWKLSATSGVSRKACSVALPKWLFWSADAFAGVLMMPKMTL